MGLIFLRHATNRFYEAKAAIEADEAAGKMPNRPLVEADFTRRRAAEPAAERTVRRHSQDPEGRQPRRGAQCRHGGDRSRLPAARGATAEGLGTLRGRRARRDDAPRRDSARTK